MNHKLFTLLLMLTVVLATHSQATQYLHDDWQFKQVRQGNWHAAQVPGEVHTDLMRLGAIDDPFFGQNEREVQWVDKEDWIYRTFFTPSDEILEKDNIDIIFKGLDTYADVYLNDTLIIKADNMFREWKVPVKNLLKQDENELRVYLHSPIKIDMPKYDALSFKYPAGNDQSENGGLFNKKLSVFARKAGYHYGWDWGPRLVTSGIWRPVMLKGWSGVDIDNMFVETQNLDDKKASLKATLEVISEDDKNCRIEIVDCATNKLLAKKKYKLAKGDNLIDMPFDISNPRLWWCNGWGEPNMYDLRCNLIVDNAIVAQSMITTGIRTIEIVREKDNEGTSFYFKLNGKPVFAKGANYIPCDNFLSRVTKDVYERTIKDAVDVNMNMLRVWGGGIYEDDYFYQLCDQNGIMVWQDFMFACSLYPTEGEMLENIKKEAIDNVKRLRNHPSIALWCGNNECLEAWHGWGWKRRLTNQGVDSIIWKQYDDLFHHELPMIVEKHAPKTFYWPSSPFSRYDGVAEPNNGDFHLWTVWGQGMPIDDYNHIRSRFFSEYGFQSFPMIETVKRYAPDTKDWDINSDVMMSHQRAGHNANNRIKKYLEDSYPEPKDFEHMLYMTQIMQGDAIRTAIEAHRRDKPYCMGSLFWQHNDCWPVASWSSRDYYGNWKAQHYYSRRAFDDILVSKELQSDTMNIYVISDRLTDTDGELRLSILSLNGNLVFTDSQNLKVPFNEVVKVAYEIDNMIDNADKNQLVILAEYVDSNGKKYESISTFLQEKDMEYSNPDIQWSVAEDNGEKLLTITADTFVRGLYVTLADEDCKYSDNFFDLLPGRPVTVKIATDCTIEDFPGKIKFMHL